MVRPCVASARLAGQSTRRNRSPRESVTWQRPPPFQLVGRDELGAAEMLIWRRRGWELRESEATPELAFLGRRRLLKGVAAGSILASRLRPAIFAPHNRTRSPPP